MPVARHPPHGPVLALLTHTVLTSDGSDRGLPHKVQPAWLASPARCPARVRLSLVLLGPRPSLRHLLRPSQAFVRRPHRYYATVRLPAAVHLGLIAHRLLPAVRVLRPTDSNGASRFSCVKFLYMPGVCDSAGPAMHLRCRTPPCCLPYSVTPSAPWIARFRSSSTSGIPACICPCPTLQVQPRDCPRMARGQDGSLLLSCMTLSFTTSRRFIRRYPR